MREKVLDFLLASNTWVVLGGVASLIAIGGALFSLCRWLLSRMRASSMVAQLERRATSPPILGPFAKDFEKTDNIKRYTRPLQSAFRERRATLTPDQEMACLASKYKLDRLALYLFQEASGQGDPAARLSYVQQEYDATSRKNFELGLVLMHYSLRSLKELLVVNPSLEDRIRSRVPDLAAMYERINGFPNIDESKHVRNNLRFVIKRLDPAKLEA